MQLSQNENYCANPNKVTLCSNHATVIPAIGDDQEVDKIKMSESQTKAGNQKKFKKMKI